MHESCKPEVEISITASLNHVAFSKSGRLGQDQISRLFQHEPNVPVDISDRAKCPVRADLGCFLHLKVLNLTQFAKLLSPC